MPLVDDRTLIAALAVVAALQLAGVDVLGMAGDWLTSQLTDSIWPW